MTMTLIEQWKDGELKDGWYYVTSKQFGMLIDRFRDQINDCGNEWRGFDNCQGIADEILAPVPSYDEYKRLQKQLSEAQEVIKLYANTTIGEKQKDGTYMYTDYMATFFSPLAPTRAIYYDPRPAKKWLKKWGVK